MSKLRLLLHLVHAMCLNLAVARLRGAFAVREGTYHTEPASDFVHNTFKRNIGANMLPVPIKIAVVGRGSVGHFGKLT